MRGSIWPFQFGSPRDIEQAEAKTTKDQTIQKRTEPAFIEPMQCKAVTALPAGENWTFDIKFDGYRCIAVKVSRYYLATWLPLVLPRIHLLAKKTDRPAKFGCGLKGLAKALIERGTLIGDEVKEVFRESVDGQMQKEEKELKPRALKSLPEI